MNNVIRKYEKRFFLFMFDDIQKLCQKNIHQLHKGFLFFSRRD